MFRNLIILTFLLLLLLSKICSSSSADAACNRTCGSRTVRYPFGFSGSCPYLLNCSSGYDGSVLSIDGFPVLSFSNTSVQIRPFRNECYQNTSVLPGSFRGRFGISGQSVLLYYNCSTPLDDCLNVTGFKNTVAKENHGYCSPDVYLASRCLWNYGQGSWLLWDDLFKVRCRYLISGFVAKPAGQGSFDIQMNSLELLWWIPGHCSSGSCDDNARCVQFLNPVNDTVHRCSCRNGFLGDGFRQGDGCISSSSKKSRLAVRLLITFLIAASAIVTATTILWKARRRVERSQGLGASADTDTPYDSLGVPVYSYESIEKATKFFADDQKLGSGAFGLVYAGKLSAGVPVAVKRMRYADERGVEQVLNEIRVLSRACHPHLVRLVGCCLERRDPILIYEHMPNGTLTEHLQGSRSPSPRPLPWNIRLRIAAESASALAYLHRDLNPPIFHRDVKSSNILLDHQLHCKVSDFGLSRLAGDASHISTAPQGTPGYLDPQYHSSFRLCDKSDVYSFGVVMAELLTGLKVLDFERQEADVSLACLVYARIATGRLDDILDPPLRTQANEDGQIRKQVWRVGELAFRCLAFDKNARPSMCEVSLDLHALLHGDTNTASASASAFTPGVCSPLPSPRPAVSASS